MGATFIQTRIPFTSEEYDCMDLNVPSDINYREKNTWVSRKSTLGLIRYDLCQSLELTTEEFPIVKAYNGEFPKELVEVSKFSKASSSSWLNGFSEDIVLDRIWNRPDFYLSKIGEGGGFIAPDFSVKLHMPNASKHFNIFRRNVLAAYAQSKGISTIVPLTWGGYDTFEYCFNGLEPGGIYAISNIGVQNNFISRKFFHAGLLEAIRVLELVL